MIVSFLEAGSLCQEYSMGLNLPPADLRTCDKPNVYGLTRMLKSIFGNGLGISLMLILILNGNTGTSMDFEKASVIVLSILVGSSTHGVGSCCLNIILS
jgi:hypothetical protein